jgi:hypothetical protein
MGIWPCWLLLQKIHWYHQSCTPAVAKRKRDLEFQGVSTRKWQYKLCVLDKICVRALYVHGIVDALLHMSLLPLSHSDLYVCALASVALACTNSSYSTKEPDLWSGCSHANRMTISICFFKWNDVWKKHWN